MLQLLPSISMFMIHAPAGSLPWPSKSSLLGRFGLTSSANTWTKLVSFSSMQQPDLAKSYFQLVFGTARGIMETLLPRTASLPTRCSSCRFVPGMTASVSTDVCSKSWHHARSALTLSFLSSSRVHPNRRHRSRSTQKDLAGGTVSEGLHSLLSISSDVVECLHGATQTRRTVPGSQTN